MKMNKVTFVVISAICLFAFFSCKDPTNPLSLITDPLQMPKQLTDLVPDVAANANATVEEVAEQLSAVSTEDLVAVATETATVSDPKLSAAILTALAAPERVNQIRALDTPKKVKILDTATNAILPVNTLISSLVPLLQPQNSPSSSVQSRTAASGSESGSASGSTTDIPEEFQLIADIIANIIDKTQSANTGAVETILRDLIAENPDYAIQLKKKTNGDIDVTDEKTISTLLATLSVTISALKSSPTHIQFVEPYTDSNGVEKVGPTQAVVTAVTNLVTDYFMDDIESDDSNLYCLIDDTRTDTQRRTSARQIATSILNGLEDPAKNGQPTEAGKEALATVLQTIAYFYTKNISFEDLAGKFSSMAGN